MTQSDESVLHVSMRIPPSLLPWFELGKIVELVLPTARSDYFHVDQMLWSDTEGHSIALSWRSPDSVVVTETRVIPRFNIVSGQP